MSEDRARAVVGPFRLRGPAEREVLLRLRGLDEGQSYCVRFDNSRHTATVSGWELSGLLVQRERLAKRHRCRWDSLNLCTAGAPAVATCQSPIINRKAYHATYTNTRYSVIQERILNYT